MTTKRTRELIDRIFRGPGIKYELTAFETLGKPIHVIFTIQRAGYSDPPRKGQQSRGRPTGP